jgi:hypothetical protein
MNLYYPANRQGSDLHKAENFHTPGYSIFDLIEVFTIFWRQAPGATPTPPRTSATTRNRGLGNPDFPGSVMIYLSNPGRGGLVAVSLSRCLAPVSRDSETALSLETTELIGFALCPGRSRDV